MAISVIQWVWDHSRSRHGSRLVLLALADCGASSWPSVAELQRKTGLGERAVHTAIADLVKLGELAVDRSAGPKGCNRYRVVMVSGGAESAPPQNQHPAESAPPENQPGPESSQASAPRGADSAPGADSAGGADSAARGAESAPGTVKNQNSSTKSSHTCGAEDGALFDDPGPVKPAPKRGRRTQPTDDPLFDAWYAAYPLHKSRGDAEKAWAEVRVAGADPQLLTEAALRYHDDPFVKRGFIKNPATWLRAKCWLDEPAPEQPPATNGHQPPGKQTNYPDEDYASGWN